MKIKIILIAVFLVIAFQTSQSQFVRNRMSGTDTTGAVLDSLTRHYTDSCNSFKDWDVNGGLFNRWYTMTIAVDDTAYISPDITFPSNNIDVVYPSESETFGPYDVISFPQWFLKSKNTDIVTYRYWFIGD